MEWAILYTKVLIFWLAWTYGGTYFHWMIREHYRQKRLNARSKIWDVQPTWTGPELNSAKRQELPKAQGSGLAPSAQNSPLGHAEAEFAMVHGANSPRETYEQQVATLSRNIDRLEKIAVQVGALSPAAATYKTLRESPRVSEEPKVSGAGATYKGYYYSPVSKLPQGARKGRRARTPDGTLWIRDTNSWNRVWHKLLPEWEKQDASMITAGKITADRIVARRITDTSLDGTSS